MTEVSQDVFETQFATGSGSGSRPSEAHVKYDVRTSLKRFGIFRII